MSLQGSLKHLHLADVIQLISVSGKTGLFHLKRGESVGLLYLKDGNIVHAEVGDIKGEDAVYELAIWDDGEFYFEPDVEPSVRSINKSNTNLLMEAARRMDEWRVLSRKIPSLELIPEFILEQSQDRGQIQLSTSEWVILTRINGKNDIRAISRLCNIPVFEVCKILYGLVTHSLINLKTAPGAARQSVAPPAISQEPTDASDNLNANKESLLLLLEKIKTICTATLGKQGESVIDKQYQKARADIERGNGMGAIQEAVTQIAKASSILKGPSTTETLLDQLKTLKL
jgi:Domain of unknown function (DUF4388)